MTLGVLINHQKSIDNQSPPNKDMDTPLDENAKASNQHVLNPITNPENGSTIPKSIDMKLVWIPALFSIGIVLLGLMFISAEKASSNESVVPTQNSSSSGNAPRSSQVSTQTQRPAVNSEDFDRAIQRAQMLIQTQKPTGNIAGIDGVKRLLVSTIPAQSPVSKGRLLKIGMSKSEVSNLLGEPDSVSAWTLSSGGRREMWFYRVSYGHITFENDYVDGWSNM
jgi:hypothetical protein